MLGLETPKYRYGFTLIEMLVLIIIMAIVSSLLIPRFQGAWQHTQFRWEKESVISFFADARRTATSYGGDVVVIYYPQQNRLEANLDPSSLPTDLPSAMLSHNQPAEIPRTLMLGDAFQITNWNTIPGIYSTGAATGNGALSSNNNPYQIVFHADGSSDDLGFTFLSQYGYQSQFELNGITGHLSEIKR